MTKYKLEYIWLDGYEPTPNLRSKTKVKAFGAFPGVDEIPVWGFDGSSTRQAEGSDSDCLLQPVAVFPDPARRDAVLVMCEVLLPDGTAHPSNTRSRVVDDPDTWFGFEQEYFLYRDGRPLGFPASGFPQPQGEYYTGVGFRNVGDVAREIVDAHIDLCIDAGLSHEGVNAEVAKGQWEFQIFGKGSKRAADEPWIARYLLLRLCERYCVDVNFHPKPLGVELDWNGSGLHTNFSSKHMREIGGEEFFAALMAAFEDHKASTSRSTAPTTTCASPGSTRRSRSTSSTTASPTEVPRSACRTASSQTATGATSRTGAPTRSAIPTGSQGVSCRRFRRWRRSTRRLSR